VPAGRVVDTLFSHVDLSPTLLALAGLEVPENMQGADLSAVVLGQATNGPDAVLLQIFVPYHPDQIEAPWRGIITDRYTYARRENEPWVLFDNRTDPWQMTNLAREPQHAKLVEELDRKLVALMKRHGDSWQYNSNELVEENGRLCRFETFYTIEEYLKWARANPAKAN
jgi:arylsulfatase A-like enzyme